MAAAKILGRVTDPIDLHGGTFSNEQLATDDDLCWARHQDVSRKTERWSRSAFVIVNHATTNPKVTRRALLNHSSVVTTRSDLVASSSARSFA